MHCKTPVTTNMAEECDDDSMKWTNDGTLFEQENCKRNCVHVYMRCAHERNNYVYSVIFASSARCLQALQFQSSLLSFDQHNENDSAPLKWTLKSTSRRSVKRKAQCKLFILPFFFLFFFGIYFLSDLIFTCLVAWLTPNDK